MNLCDILRFATGSENELILGFTIQPSIAFVDHKRIYTNCKYLYQLTVVTKTNTNLTFTSP